MDVICLGILVADLFASSMPALPAPGQLGLTDRFLLGAGGYAKNTAACLGRLGHRVKGLGKVGSDFFGDFCLNDPDRLGVESSCFSPCRRSQTSGTSIF